MSFTDQVQASAAKAQEAIEAQKAIVAENAKKVLIETLGEDANLIQGISLNADTGKFHSINAPEHVIAKLKAANLVEA